MATLRFYRGDELLIEYRLRPGRTTIGRADACDVALPGETISRTHCIVQGRPGGWAVVDRSRHGTRVDGVPVTGKAPLHDGAVLGLGDYTVRVSLTARDPRPTAPQEPDQSHEIVLCADDGGLHLQRAVLVAVAGQEPGRRFTLDSMRVSVGGAGSTVVLKGAGLVRDHCWLRISRGRVMIEPGKGAVWLDGQRVRGITPLYAEEDFRLGDAVLRVELGQVAEEPFANRFGEMVAHSRSMRRLFGVLRRMSGHHFTVLVVGESGTGKELISRAVHDHSPRADRAFVALNCGAISEQLFESELFGHEKGAFTGADRRKDGAFHQADGGTLFLDEIGELPEAAQAKLLRALETGEVRRVGSTTVTHPDVRVVAATNRDLAQQVRLGRFRGDLFFRLAVLSVDVPPLRDRPDDLEVLCKTLCQRLHPECHVTPDAIEVLRRHRWPGNVRELRNVLTRAFVLGGPRIDMSGLTFHQLTPVPDGRAGVAPGEAEKLYLQGILQKHGDNRSAVARELGVARSTLHYKLKKYGLM